MSFSRVVLKITGESFQPWARLEAVVQEIGSVVKEGCEIAVVVGGGNILRGRSATMIERVNADAAGMVATVINGIVLADRLGRLVPTTHLAAFGIPGIVEQFTPGVACQALAAGRVVILSGGTGNPLLSTDTAALVRACQVKAQAVLKGTKVKGIYTADPVQERGARFLPRVTFADAIRRRLAVVDAAALVLGRETQMPIIVFELFAPGNLARIIKGEPIGSCLC